MSAQQTADRVRRVFMFAPVRFAAVPGSGSCPILPIAELGLWLEGTVGTIFKVTEWIRELAGDVEDVEVRTDFDKGLILLRIGNRAWPILAMVFESLAVQVCRNCGCTDDLGCSDGCSWVEPDLCSSCA